MRGGGGSHSGEARALGALRGGPGRSLSLPLLRPASPESKPTRPCLTAPSLPTPTQLRRYVRLYYIERMDVDKVHLALTLHFVADSPLVLKFQGARSGGGMLRAGAW